MLVQQAKRCENIPDCCDGKTVSKILSMYAFAAIELDGHAYTSLSST